MKTFYDIQQLLKRFGIFIYTGHRLADLELMESEIHELHRLHLIEPSEYTLAMVVIRQEMNKEMKK